MVDIEKLKQGLHCCIVQHMGDARRCPECPYRDPTTDCTNVMHRDVLEAFDELTELLDVLTSDECEECKIDGGEEQQGGEPWH